MKKVITYGTYDPLHQRHINLLKRARSLGDYVSMPAAGSWKVHFKVVGIHGRKVGK